MQLSIRFKAYLLRGLLNLDCKSEDFIGTSKSSCLRQVQWLKKNEQRGNVFHVATLSRSSVKEREIEMDGNT